MTSEFSNNLGLMTFSRLVSVREIRSRTDLQKYWQVTGNFNESVMLNGKQIIVPRGFRKITYRG